MTRIFHITCDADGYWEAMDRENRSVLIGSLDKEKVKHHTFDAARKLGGVRVVVYDPSGMVQEERTFQPLKAVPGMYPEGTKRVRS